MFRAGLCEGTVLAPFLLRRSIVANAVLTSISLLSLCAISATAANSPAQAIDLPVSPISLDHKVKLSEGIAQIGLRISGGYVSFGIDIRTIPEPEVELKLTSTTPLGIALTQVLAQVRGYEYEAASDHVIDVQPVQELRNSKDIWNIRVADFLVKNEAAMNIFARPKKYIPELRDYLLKNAIIQTCGSIGPGLGSDGAGVSVSLHGVTVREILNTVAEADAVLPEHSVRHDLPVGWIHRLKKGKDDRVVDTWSFLSTVPRNWGHILQAD